MQRTLEAITVKVASFRKIHSWSFGEISTANTINLTSLRPEDGGLFCCKVFGPEKNFECQCGKYKLLQHHGIICERCSVEITTSQTRRERLGHLNLSIPVSHLWFFRTSPLALEALLSISSSEVERLLYYEAKVVVDHQKVRLPPLSIISNEDLATRAKDIKGELSVKTGAEAVRFLMEAIDVEELRLSLEESLELARGRSPYLIRMSSRLRVLQSLQEFEIEPDCLLPKVLPVLPPELRPMIPLGEGKFAASDLNDLYCKVINRNSRLKKLLELQAPVVVIQNEKKLLQEAVDCLIDNGRNGRAAVKIGKRPMKSLTEMLRGKTGRFRQNLLGKRVDYSGRAVITVGPELMLHQCGIPKKMFLELFQPFLFVAKSENKKLATAESQKKENQERLEEELWTSVGKRYPILLNRAPTLHRLGIQAFEPIAIEGNAIRLNPLVCAAFNADFDGDQMAIHLPLSLEAQLEAKMLMLAVGNLLLPTNGRPAFLPTQEAVLGLYFCTNKAKGRQQIVSESVRSEEIVKATKIGNLRFGDVAKVVMEEQIKHRSKMRMISRTYWTTAGRCLLGRTIPSGLTFGMLNCTLQKGKLSSLISLAMSRCKLSDVCRFIERLVSKGFSFATEAGMSLSITDFCVPTAKDDLIRNSLEWTASANRRSKVSSKLVGLEGRTNLWLEITYFIKMAMLEALHHWHPNSRQLGEVPNPVFMMIDSGARGSEEQVRQIAGMRGLMVKPDGSILEVPIISNFREGLTSLQYFISAHGARKGLADTALKTANSGYLTRRLADTSHNLVIREFDCQTKVGVKLANLSVGSEDFRSATRNSLGRNVMRTTGPETWCQPIEEEVWEELLGNETTSFTVRSPVTCQSTTGLCSTCYGSDVSTGDQVSIGEAVGIIAAQSIGEPGTQLTMRTFHVGGTASLRSRSERRHQPLGHILFSQDLRIIRNKHGQLVAVSESGTLIIKDRFGATAVVLEVPCGSILAVSNYSNVGPADILFRHQDHIPVLTEVSGTVQLGYDAAVKHHFIGIWGAKQLKAAFPLEVGTTLKVKSNQKLEVGQVLGCKPFASTDFKDITGGLLLVSDAFETRTEKVTEILSEVTGLLTISLVAKGLMLTVIGPDSCQQRFKVEVGRQLAVRTNQLVRRGDTLVTGSPDLHSTLSLRGLGPLVRAVTSAIQSTYKSQNVEIHDKHIEVMIRQMLRYVVVQTVGSTNYFRGEQVERSEMTSTNLRMVQSSKQPATSRPLLMGITRSSLSTKSFISSASFQETSKILARASALGSRDRLCGLKENVIIGRMMPAGTGFMFHQSKGKDAND